MVSIAVYYMLFCCNCHFISLTPLAILFLCDRLSRLMRRRIRCVTIRQQNPVKTGTIGANKAKCLEFLTKFAPDTSKRGAHQERLGQSWTKNFECCALIGKAPVVAKNCEDRVHFVMIGARLRHRSRVVAFSHIIQRAHVKCQTTVKSTQMIARVSNGVPSSTNFYLVVILNFEKHLLATTQIHAALTKALAAELQ
jgi:hypothetical protein